MFYRLFLLSVLLTFLLPVVSAGPPNIVIFLADDLGYGDIGCYGHPTISTPNIDQMAAQGLKLTQFYSAAPICSSSRSSLLTGRLPIRNGVYTQSPWPEDTTSRVFIPWSTGSLPNVELTLPGLLKKEKNYTSAIIGKWHLGHVDALPQRRGFDYFYGVPYSHEEGCPPGLGFNCSRDWQAAFPPVPLYRNEKIIEQPVNLHTFTSRSNEEAINFIKQSHSNDQPFFLLMAYLQTHVPLFASSEFFGKSRRGLYGDAIMEMDHSIGVILSAIHSLQIQENTLVLFTSDNGPWLLKGNEGGSPGLLHGGKGETWEGGMREPAVFYWPRTIPPGIVSEEITSMMDLFSTALDLAGIPEPSDRIIDGVSLLPILKGSRTQNPNEQIIPLRECYFYYRQHTLHATRCGQFKAHFVTRCGFCERPPVHHNPPLMYNIEEDPSESILIDNKSETYATQLAIIQAAVAEHQRTLIPGKPQLNPINPSVAPCCDINTKCFCNATVSTPFFF